MEIGGEERDTREGQGSESTGLEMFNVKARVVRKRGHGGEEG